MSDSTLRLNIHQNVATVIFNRPDKRNAISRALMADLAEMLDDLHRQKSVRSVILTGAGPAFCAGMDLAEMQETASGDDPHAQWNDDAAKYRDLLEFMLRFPKPLIAAVNGPALAGGAGIVLACDVVVAADTAKFGLPEPLRGLVAGVVSPLLAFRVGGGWSSYLMITSQVIDSQHAARIGLFHETIAADLLWPRAVEIAVQCAKCAPEAIQLSKQMLNGTIGENLSTLLSAGAAVSATARTTEAAKEGLAAFFEKRSPVWK